MNDNCPCCKGSGKQWNKAIGFAYDIVLITLEEYKNNKDKINNLIDIKCDLMKISFKDRMKENAEEYYKELMRRVEDRKKI